MAFFVTRIKRNIKYRRCHYHQVDKSTGLRSDQTIILKNPITLQQYPTHLRRISFVDADTHKRFVFLTNNFNLHALIIPQLYKRRWQVELFFKWIKQHLRIKSFFGTSENAVKTQIWIAISIYVLVAIIKKKFKLELKLSEILQILSITLFEKVSLPQVLTQTTLQNKNSRSRNQLLLPNL